MYYISGDWLETSVEEGAFVSKIIVPTGPNVLSAIGYCPTTLKVRCDV